MFCIPTVQNLGMCCVSFCASQEDRVVPVIMFEQSVELYGFVAILLMAQIKIQTMQWPWNP